MATIYSQTPGGLFAQPGRAVTTFPSGLVRVDQTYICATVDAENHRSTLAVGAAMPDGNDSPSMDGIFIHPEPQEVQRGDGFTEFKVSAYGRTKQEFTGLQLKQIPKYGTAMVADTPVPVYCYVWEITGFIVVPFGQSITIEDLTYDAALNDPFNFSETLYGAIIDSTKIDDYNYLVDMGTTDDAIAAMGASLMSFNSYQNFGSFAEVSVTVSRGVSETVI